MPKRKLILSVSVAFIWFLLYAFLQNPEKNEIYTLGIGTVMLLSISLGSFQKPKYRYMKAIKIMIGAIIVTCGSLFFTACKNGNKSSNATDTTANSQPLPKPPDNSDATNPSLADTAYGKKDTSKTKEDSSVFRK